MRMIMRRSLVLALLGVLIAVDGGVTQERGGTDIAAALASVRSAARPGAARAILAQQRGAHSRADRDALADSLVAIAIAFKRGDPIEMDRAARAARVALASAAAPSRATPYEGAFEALTAIVERSGEVGVRASTLWFVAQLPNGPAVREYLAEFAVSSDELAYYAVGLLGRETGPAGLARLRRLYRDGSVVEPNAVKELAGLAEYHGWR